MSTDNPVPSYLSRVISSDIVKKGAAGVAAAVLVAAITEFVWPSK